MFASPLTRLPAPPKMPPASLYSQTVTITEDTEDEGLLTTIPGKLGSSGISMLKQMHLTDLQGLQHCGSPEMFIENICIRNPKEP